MQHEHAAGFGQANDNLPEVFILVGNLLEPAEVGVVFIGRGCFDPARDVEGRQAGDFLDPGLFCEVERDVVNPLKGLPRQHVVGLEQNQHGFAPLAEPLLETLLDERVFLTFERRQQALRSGVGLELGDLRGEREGDENRECDHERSPLRNERGEPIQRLLSSGHERVCPLDAKAARLLSRLDRATCEG